MIAALCASCADGRGVLEVALHGPVYGVDRLHVLVQISGDRLDTTVYPSKRPFDIAPDFAFSVSFAPSRRGDVTVSVDVLDAAGNTLAHGQESGNVTPSRQTQLAIVLAPSNTADMGIADGTDNGMHGGGDGAIAPFGFTLAGRYMVPRPLAAIALGKVNTDQALDVVVQDDGGVVLLLGKGDGSLGMPMDNPLATPVAGLAVADFSLHHLSDVAVGESSKTVDILKSQGDGTFATTGFAIDTPSAMAAGDLDGNGTLDLAIAFLAGGLKVALGQGDGTFKYSMTALPLSTGKNPASVAIGDLDGDGIPDIVVANSGDATVTVIPGKDMGTHQIYGVGNMPSAVALADLNGDTRLDVAVANQATSNVSILLARGDGTLAAATQVLSGNGSVAIAAADLNADGKVDLLVANQADNLLSVLLGNGDGTFAAADSIKTGNQPSAVAVGDLNGDGKPDIVVGNRGDGGVQVFLQN